MSVAKPMTTEYSCNNVIITTAACWQVSWLRPCYTRSLCVFSGSVFLLSCDRGMVIQKGNCVLKTWTLEWKFITMWEAVTGYRSGSLYWRLSWCKGTAQQFILLSDTILQFCKVITKTIIFSSVFVLNEHNSTLHTTLGIVPGTCVTGYRC